MARSLYSIPYRVIKAVRENEKSGPFQDHRRRQQMRRDKERELCCPSCGRDAGCNCYNGDEPEWWFLEGESAPQPA